MPAPDAGARAAAHRLFGTTVSSNFPFTTPLVPSSTGLSELAFTVTSEPNDPDELEILFESDRRGPHGAPAASLSRWKDLHVLRFAGESTFTISDNEITVFVEDGGSKRFAELAFLGPVVALWLEIAGVTTLHASAVEGPEGAIVFIGGQGTRKTSCAAALLRNSHRLLADDLVAVEQTAQGFVCRPGYPEMRMWPREAEFFVSPPQPPVPVQPGSEKLRIRIGEDGFGAFSAENAPLQALYVLDSEPGDEVSIRSLQASRAIVRLVGGSSVPSLTTALGMEVKRLRTLSSLVSSVPVAEIKFPSGPEGALAIADAVLPEVS